MNPIGIYLVNQHSGDMFSLDPEQENIIGRKIGNEINEQATILLPHPAISKKHVQIYINPDTQVWHLQNFSRNGILVNRKEILEFASLSHGDQIDIGPYQFVFYEKFHGDATMEYEKDDSHFTTSKWEDNESGTLRTLLETIVTIFLLGLIGFMLYYITIW